MSLRFRVAVLAGHGRHVDDSPFVPQRLGLLPAKERTRDLEQLVEYLVAGKVAPSLARSFPPPRPEEAMRPLKAGWVRGNVVIVPLTTEPEDNLTTDTRFRRVDARFAHGDAQPRQVCDETQRVPGSNPSSQISKRCVPCGQLTLRHDHGQTRLPQWPGPV